MNSVDLKYNIFVILMEKCGVNYFGGMGELMKVVDYIYNEITKVSSITSSCDCDENCSCDNKGLDSDDIESYLDYIFYAVEELDARVREIEADLAVMDEYEDVPSVLLDGDDVPPSRAGVVKEFSTEPYIQTYHHSVVGTNNAE